MPPVEQFPGDAATPWDAEVNADGLFDVLSNTRRRYVIAHLQTRSKPMALADVATELARWECDARNDRIPKDEVLPRFRALYHDHVPKMADVGVIEWNDGRNTITIGEGYEEILDEFP